MKNKILILAVTFFLSPFGGVGGGLFAQALPGAGNCLQYNGTSDKVQMTETNLNYVTVESWVKPTNYVAGTYMGICQSYGAEASDYGGFTLKIWMWGGYLYPTGWVNTGPTTNYQVTSTVPITLNKWSHVAFTFDGTALKIYVDGVLSNTTAVAATTIRNPTTSYNFIGSGKTWSGSPNALFFGDIDEVRIWDYARTQTEIRNTMCQKLAGNEAGLVGYWRFDETNGNTAFDSSPNGNNGTLQ